jgi:hypothetical protein
MCIVKDTIPLLGDLYTRLFNEVLKEGMPEIWRMARVIPLHKKVIKLISTITGQFPTYAQ